MTNVKSSFLNIGVMNLSTFGLLLSTYLRCHYWYFVAEYLSFKKFIVFLLLFIRSKSFDNVDQGENNGCDNNEIRREYFEKTT